MATRPSNCLPSPPPRLSMAADPRVHLFVARLRGGDERHRSARVGGQAHGHRRFAAPRAAQQKDEGHQKSMPRIARTPRSNACFVFLISVTVSATSTSSAGASRPVAMMLTEGGRLRITSTTSEVGIQPQFIG